MFTRPFFTVLLGLFIVSKLNANALPGLNPNEWRESFVKYNYDAYVSHGESGAKETKNSQYSNLVIKTPFKNKKEKYWFSIYETKSYNFSSETAFASIGTVIPKKLFLNRLGVGFVKKGEHKWGLWGAYKSQGDEYFSSAADASYDLSYVYFPKTENKQKYWIWMLNYSSKRSFLKGWPLPGFAYVYKPSKKFFAVFGLPFVMLNYIDFPRTIAFAQISPFGIKARWAKGVFGPIMAFASYKFSMQNFILSDRKNEDDRLYYQGQRVDLGVFMPLSRKTTLETSIAYEYDREMYMSDSIYTATSERKNLTQQWLMGMYIKYKF